MNNEMSILLKEFYDIINRSTCIGCPVERTYDEIYNAGGENICNTIIDAIHESNSRAKMEENNEK